MALRGPRFWYVNDKHEIPFYMLNVDFFLDCSLNYVRFHFEICSNHVNMFDMAAFFKWTHSPDRIVGFDSRVHVEDKDTKKWKVSFAVLLDKTQRCHTHSRLDSFVVPH
jgi:hypothetical protein